MGRNGLELHSEPDILARCVIDFKNGVGLVWVEKCILIRKPSVMPFPKGAGGFLRDCKEYVKEQFHANHYVRLIVTEIDIGFQYQE